MIARIIEWSARNMVLVLIGTLFLALAGAYAVKTTPLDAIPRSFGYASHRLYRVCRTGTAGGRGPGNLSPHHVLA